MKSHITKRIAKPATLGTTASPTLLKTNTYQVVEFDLVDEAQWEDRARDEGLFLTLEEAGLEESQEGDSFDCGGAYAHAQWFYDNDEDAFTAM